MGAILRITLLMLVIFLPVAQGCGKKGPPLPPVEEKSTTAPPVEAAPEGKPAEPQPSPAPEPKAPY